MRVQAREAAFQVIFSELLGGEVAKGARARLYTKAKLGEEDAAFAERLISAVEGHKEEIAAKISAAVTRYADYRIYPADRAALMIAIAELDYLDEVPPIVSVSEATALARRYSTEKSADFVNGVLGGILNK